MTAQFLSDVQAALGSAAVKTAPSDTQAYATDWRKRYHGRPLAVIFPSSTDQVAQVVRLANRDRVALVPQGGNTGLSGGATPDESGAQAILCLTRMTAVRAQDVANKTVTVEAGITLQRVQEIAQEIGLLFPLSLGAEGSATIGGNLATNAGGTAVLRYGNARELCLGLEVVTPTGEIWNGLRSLRKDNTGYDLRDLFIGSEGTLGIITAAVLKLFPRPAGMAAVLAQVKGAAEALSLLQIAQSRCDAALTGFEFMSAESTQIVARYLPDIARPFAQIIGGFRAHGGHGVSPSASVLIEISHPHSEAAAIQMLEDVMQLAMDQGLVLEAVVSQSHAQMASLWHLRESITYAAAEDGVNMKHDIALPISCLVEFISAMDQEILQNFPDVRLINFGHFGDGNLHYNIAPPLALGSGKSRQERHALNQQYLDQHEDGIRRRVHDRVAAMNGSISAEHGLGQLRRQEARRYKSPLELDMMGRIKLALDPNGILNPGKML